MIRKDQSVAEGSSLCALVDHKVGTSIQRKAADRIPPERRMSGRCDIWTNSSGDLGCGQRPVEDEIPATTRAYEKIEHVLDSQSTTRCVSFTACHEARLDGTGRRSER